MPGRSSSRLGTRSLLVLICLVSLGQSLYFARLQSITLDEATTLADLFQAVHSDPRLLFKDIHMPAFNLLLAGWLSIFRFELFYSKVFTALCSVASVVLCYRLARMLFGTRAGLIAAGLLALSPQGVYYSQFGRSYSLYLATAILSYLGFFRLRQSPCGKAAAGYFLGTTLLVLSHFVGWSVVAAQVALLSFEGCFRGEARRAPGIVKYFGIALAGVLLCYLPVLITLLGRYNLIRDIPIVYSWVPKPTWADIPDTYLFFAGGVGVAAVTLALFLYLGLKKWKSHDAPPLFSSDSAVPALLFWLLLPAAMLLLWSALHHPVFLQRGFLPSIVPFVILTAVALEHVFSRPKVLAGVLILVSGLSLFETYRSSYQDRGSWFEASKAVGTPFAPNDTSQKVTYLLFPAFVSAPFSYHFRSPCFFAPDRDLCLRSQGVFALSKMEDLRGLLRPGVIFRFIGFLPQPEDNSELIQRIREIPSVTVLSEEAFWPSTGIANFTFRESGPGR